MTIPDLINGVFEASGSLFILLSIRRLYEDKLVRGVSFIHVGFFSLWGVWNLYYYPHLGQWLSFAGGVLITVSNMSYTYLLVYYILRERHERP